MTIRRRLAASVTAASLVAAAAYTLAVALALVSVVGQDPSSDAYCPTCEVLPLGWKVVAAVAVVTTIVAFTASVVGLLGREGLRRTARVGLWLLAWGGPLMLLLGAGTMLVVPGLIVLAVGLRRTPLVWYLPLVLLAA